MVEPMQISANRQPLSPEEREQRSRDHDRAREERKQRERTEAYASAVGAKYAPCTLENFEVYHPNQQPVVEALKAIRDDIWPVLKSRRNILLYGNAGTGKDHLKAALLKRVKELSYENPESYVSVQSIAGEEILSGDSQLNRNFYSGRRSIVSLSDPINPCGSQPDWQMCKLFNFVDECYRHQEMLWVSMNAASLDEAKERLSTPLYERIVENAIIVECRWPSYRTKSMPEVIGAKKGKA